MYMYICTVYKYRCTTFIHLTYYILRESPCHDHLPVVVGAPTAEATWGRFNRLPRKNPLGFCGGNWVPKQGRFL